MAIMLYNSVFYFLFPNNIYLSKTSSVCELYSFHIDRNSHFYTKLSQSYPKLFFYFYAQAFFNLRHKYVFF